MVHPIFVGSPCQPVILKVVSTEEEPCRRGAMGDQVALVMAVRKSPPLNRGIGLWVKTLYLVRSLGQLVILNVVEIKRLGEISRGGALGNQVTRVTVKSVHLLIEAVACGDEETL